MIANTTSPKTIAFFGATGGCTAMALRKSLEAGHTCIALCRTPSKLTDKFPSNEFPNLHVMQGNAHDQDAVTKCIVDSANPARFVDAIVFGIGGTIDMSKMAFTDPNVCENGIKAVLGALDAARAQNVTGQPKLVAISTTGISKAGNDIPCLMMPLYKGMLGTPHADKKLMEERILASHEDFSVVRPSWLVDRTPEQEAAEKNPKPVRVALENTEHQFETKEIGYTISRSAVGRFIYESLIENPRPEYSRKMIGLTW